MHHAIIVEESLTRKQVLKYFTILHTKKIDKMTLHVIESPDQEAIIERFQKYLKPNKPYYFHIYNNGFLMIVVFRHHIFRINPNNKNTWLKAIKYGLMLGIPKEQLNFYPTRIAEEKEWLR